MTGGRGRVYTSIDMMQCGGMTSGAMEVLAVLTHMDIQLLVGFHEG